MLTVDFLVFVIYAIAFGTVVAFLVSLLTRLITSKFISALISKGANTPESAKTLDELGVLKNPLLKLVLKSSTLKRTVLSEGERYYLPEEKEEKALRFWGGERLTFSSIIVMVLLIIALLVILKYLPELI